VSTRSAARHAYPTRIAMQQGHKAGRRLWTPEVSYVVCSLAALVQQRNCDNSPRRMPVRSRRRLGSCYDPNATPRVVPLWRRARNANTLCGVFPPYARSQEDAQLTREVARFGAAAASQHWADIARAIPTRNSKQCRDRWLHHLSGTDSKDSFTHEEETQLFLLQRQLGNRWAAIATRLPGRTESSIKNRFWSAVRRVQRAGGGVSAELATALLSAFAARFEAGGGGGRWDGHDGGAAAATAAAQSMRAPAAASAGAGAAPTTSKPSLDTALLASLAAAGLAGGAAALPSPSLTSPPSLRGMRRLQFEEPLLAVVAAQKASGRPVEGSSRARAHVSVAPKRKQVWKRCAVCVRAPVCILLCRLHTHPCPAPPRRPAPAAPAARAGARHGARLPRRDAHGAPRASPVPCRRAGVVGTEARQRRVAVCRRSDVDDGRRRRGWRRGESARQLRPRRRGRGRGGHGR